MIMCQRIDAGTGKAFDLQISAHLAQFLSRFPRPLYEVEKSVGEGVREKAIGLLDHVQYRQRFSSDVREDVTAIYIGTAVGEKQILGAPSKGGDAPRDEIYGLRCRRITRKCLHDHVLMAAARIFGRSR
jgi:hypothetical protein